MKPNKESAPKENNTPKGKKPNKFRNGRKPRRNNGKVVESKTPEISPMGDNDPNWYMHNPALVRDTAMVPFSTPQGQTLLPKFSVDTRFEGGTYASYALAANYINPGVMGFEIVPTVGISKTKGSPINIAAQKVYANVRSKKSGTLNYDAPDMMMYILAMDQLYSFHQWMRRVYGYINTFSSQNLYVPRAFAEVDHIDFDDLLSHMTDFRFYINNFALRLSTYLVPQEFDLFRRHAFMYSNIYMDAPVAKAQFYMFTPHCFMKFSETDLDTGTALIKFKIDRESAKLTFSAIKEMGEELLNAIIYSEDANTISGDVKRAYETSALWAPIDTPENFAVLPVYSGEILGQIHNANIVGTFASLKYNNQSALVVQDVNKGIILSNVYGRANAMIKDFLDTVSDTPTPAEIMVNTRLKASVDTNGDSVSDESGKYFDLITGSEFIHQAFIIVMNSSGNMVKQTMFPTCQVLSYQMPGNLTKYTQVVQEYSKFNMAPILPMLFTPKLPSAVTAASDLTLRTLGDFNNPTTITVDNLRDLHLVAITSLLGV